MARPRKLDDTEAMWAHGEWIRGCDLDDIAVVLGVSRWTLQREFKRRRWQKPSHIPDKDWIMPPHRCKITFTMMLGKKFA